VGNDKNPIPIILQISTIDTSIIPIPCSSSNLDQQHNIRLSFEHLLFSYC